MGKRRAAAAAAVSCWGGAAAITAAGFEGMGDIEAWTRLSSLLLWSAAVLSITWVVDRFVVTPRSAYRLGVEAGLRQAGRRQGADVPPEPLPLPLRLVRDVRQATSAR